MNTRMGRVRREVQVRGLGMALILLACPALQASPLSKSLESGLTWVVEQTTPMRKLTIAPGAMVTAPLGHSVTMTINGVETGLRPGSYEGNIVLTVTEANPVKFSETITHDFRQALYLDSSGVVAAKSVLSAAGTYAIADDVLSGVKLTSVGENFNGILVAGGHYTVKGATLDFSGNGGDDFAGYGAAIMATGADARLVVDGARIRTRGVVRTAAVADKGSHLIVKNSTLTALAGTLPPDYVPNSALGLMKNVPWMLGVAGNNRATNLLGDNTTATYINSSITAEEWGVLSVDLSSNTRLTAINCKLSISGKSGYGTYAIGNSTNSFYGSEIRVPDYAAVVTGGHVIYGASTPAILAQLNTDLKLGLSAAELSSLPQRPTAVHSGRFGLMIWGDATVKIMDDTIFDTAQSTFLIKSAAAEINVDGSKGTRLSPKNGVILQLMETDNPGPVVQNGARLTIGVYHEPKNAPAKASDFDVTGTHDTDVVANLANIDLRGNFYNAARGANPNATPPIPAVGGAPSVKPPPAGRNLILNLDLASISGVITASDARHALDTITAEDYRQLGEVNNTPGAAINNGVIVSLTKSTWTVTGTSYLTSLTIGDGSSVQAAPGSSIAMSVDGQPTPLAKGTYKGQIVLTLTKS
jgi:hypothetical protein